MSIAGELPDDYHMVMMVAAVAVMPIWLRKCAGREEREQDNYQIFLHVRTVTNPTMIVCAIKLSFLIITRQPIGPSQGHPGAKFCSHVAAGPCPAVQVYQGIANSLFAVPCRQFLHSCPSRAQSAGPVSVD
jgi:hypothetical protein